jgi:hypothetical protein
MPSAYRAVASHPYRDVAIVAVHNTAQAPRLDGHDSLSITIEAAFGVLEAAGVPAGRADGADCVGGDGRQARSTPAGLGPHAHQHTNQNHRREKGPGYQDYRPSLT